jgi:hypothetical protein
VLCSLGRASFRLRGKFFQLGQLRSQGGTVGLNIGPGLLVHFVECRTAAEMVMVDLGVLAVERLAEPFTFRPQQVVTADMVEFFREYLDRKSVV